MKYSNRCDKHKIFIGKDGCKICNEIKQIEQVGDEHYDYYVSECLINVKLKKENERLHKVIDNHIVSCRKREYDYNQEVVSLNTKFDEISKEIIIENENLKKENEHLKLCNDNNFYHYKLEEKENKEFKDKIKKLESKELPSDVKEAITYLSRNEKPIFTNLFAAESIIASIWDLYLQIPEKRRNSIKPLADYILSIADQMNVLDTEIATKAVKSMGSSEYNNLIIDTIRVLDVSAGKIKNCETCIHALERKELIKKEIKNGKV